MGFFHLLWAVYAILLLDERKTLESRGIGIWNVDTRTYKSMYKSNSFNAATKHFLHQFFRERYWTKDKQKDPTKEPCSAGLQTAPWSTSRQKTEEQSPKDPQHGIWKSRLLGGLSRCVYARASFNSKTVYLFILKPLKNRKENSRKIFKLIHISTGYWQNLFCGNSFKLHQLTGHKYSVN